MPFGTISGGVTKMNLLTIIAYFIDKPVPKVTPNHPNKGFLLLLNSTK